MAVTLRCGSPAPASISRCQTSRRPGQWCAASFFFQPCTAHLHLSSPPDAAPCPPVLSGRPSGRALHRAIGAMVPARSVVGPGRHVEHVLWRPRCGAREGEAIVSVRSGPRAARRHPPAGFGPSVLAPHPAIVAVHRLGEKRSLSSPRNSSIEQTWRRLLAVCFSRSSIRRPAAQRAVQVRGLDALCGAEAAPPPAGRAPRQPAAV